MTDFTFDDLLNLIQIPQTEQQYDEVRENEQDEVEAIRPDLQTLVQDYQVQTDEIVKDYQKGFHLIDKEVDGVLQTVFAETDQADIEAIKAQLSRPRLNS